MIKIADNLSLPLDAVTQTISIIAKRRAGKSYTARRFAEELFRSSQQIVIVDPKGDWWGIRSSADGKAPGLPVVILGGEHGDVPLEANSGEIVAKLVVEEQVSVLLDLSFFRKYEVAQFMAIFLETLYRLKAKERYRTPVMLVIDEADAIAPQKPNKGEERMLGAAEDIVRRGGQRGIGCLLVTQRSAVLNKNVLTQSQIIVALRTIAPQDIAALDAWIEVHGSEKERQTLLDSIASLPTGDAWFWSPGWPHENGVFKRVHVLPITTFDSGATPKPGEKRIQPKNIADVDLEALTRQMASTIERAKADDPRELKRRIAELEKQARARPAEKIAEPVEVKVPVITPAEFEILGESSLSFLDHAQKVIASGKEIAEMLKSIRDAVSQFKPIVSQKALIVSPNRQTVSRNGTGVSSRPHLTTTREPAAFDPSLGGPTRPQRNILNALNDFAALGIDAVSRKWVAARAGASHKSSAYLNNLSALRSAGLIEYREGGQVMLTNHAAPYLEPREALTAEQLFESCVRIISNPQGRILKALSQAYPVEINREKLADLAGASPTSSAYLNNLSALRSAGMIEYTGDKKVRAADWLFPN